MDQLRVSASAKADLTTTTGYLRRSGSRNENVGLPPGL